MNTDFDPIKEFSGGSLSSVYALDEKIIKSYKGGIYRGYQKLLHEQQWLNNLPIELHEKHPNFFPRVLNVIDSPESKTIEVHLSRVNRLSLTKLILSGKIDEIATERNLSVALTMLTKNLYPIRSGNINSTSIYEIFHSSRIAYSKYHLINEKYFKPFFCDDKIVVNNIVCPSINTVLDVCFSRSSNLFSDASLCAFHGNFHLDNILVNNNSDFSNESITFIDPRGDPIGPPHYDFSKLLFSLEGYYDEINYGGFEVKSSQKIKYTHIELKINPTRDSIYKALIPTLLERSAEFAELEGITHFQFQKSVLASEWIHVLSFIFYHAKRTPPTPEKCIAFFAMLALLGRRLLNFIENKDAVDFNDRISIE